MAVVILDCGGSSTALDKKKSVFIIIALGRYKKATVATNALLSLVDRGKAADGFESLNRECKKYSPLLAKNART